MLDSAGRPICDAAADWLRARARLMPGALGEIAEPARGEYAHEWAPVQLLGRRMACLPPELWAALLRWESGYAILVSGASRYEPGQFDFRGRSLRGVALISLEDLAGKAPGSALHVMAHLVDHHLGCGGEAQGAWLSEGGGMVPAWREAGQRLARLFELGYGLDEAARSSKREYFAESLAAYCRERRALNVADPQIAKWFRTTLWSPRFWVRERAR